MVLQKRLDGRFNGYRFPSFAKGKRSVRRRNVGSGVSAFDLLAYVAGSLLLEKEKPPADNAFLGTSSSSLSNEKGIIRQDSSEVSAATPKNIIERQDGNNLKENSQDVNISRSFIVSSYSGKKYKETLKKISDKSFEFKIGTEAPQSVEHCVNETARGNSSGTDNLGHPVKLVVKPPFISSKSIMESSFSSGIGPCHSSFPGYRNGLELSVNRDDDETFSGCIHPCTVTNKASNPHVREQRIRKLVARRFWKTYPRAEKHDDLSKTDAERKPAFHDRNFCHTHQRSQRISFKRRKLSSSPSYSASRRGFSGTRTFNLFKKKVNLEGCNSSTALRKVNGLSSITEHTSSYKPEDFHVKLSIKSFKVPELFIEIPENATVGSLKRTVMESATAIIGGGLHVGVLLQGKNVRDDDRTLLQAGIAHANKLDELSFTLEPNADIPSKTNSALHNPQFFLPCDGSIPLTRNPAQASSDQANCMSSLNPALTSDHDSVQSRLHSPSIDRSSFCRALVPVNRPRGPELVHRRIRRPFTVSEVEALVQAVEKLGTGRWRDVKLCAFDNAKHRTYVDLKDKWKTLVHTARISPQQRRGEPVPQELLDRVLCAHAYWSDCQAKLQMKPPPLPPTEASLHLSL
ncbi:Telomere repeat-binding protein 2 [Apostasia shenzhenica]|uniref:Telomere repeat-binding protein 2 n=1 Tax=Apostasia shenzhenica TaxID=1088818 RepID=A0A2I0B620_9ASPA|nr:Telomere repeat-binding protein 2 [Apostasia shenzhenica]